MSAQSDHDEYDAGFDIGYEAMRTYDRRALHETLAVAVERWPSKQLEGFLDAWLLGMNQKRAS